MNDDKILSLISNETKDSISPMNVVTPGVYASIFHKFASQHDIKVDDDYELSKGILSHACENFISLQNQTSHNALKLSQTTNKALTAMKEKDESALNEVIDETQLLRHEIEKLKAAVYKDELTGAYNRKWLHDNLIDENSGKLNSEGTIAIIDINYFKTINDTYGHVIGDKVLVFLTNQLKKTKYSVVRYGGDEFIVLFSKRVSKKQALSILNSIRETVLSKILKAHESSFKVSFSFGVCEYENGNELEKILEYADTEMYNDKSKIKQRITGIEI
jgi:diguanylate cyclase (GGDEF)-like protein